jgi:DNA repair protein RadA/Sms
VVGWDPSRLSMLVAVLEAHGRVKLGQHDIYLNVAGGMKISEPAADLAAAAALVSSLTGAVLPHDMVFFGEVGLSGAVRPVPHANLRLKESAKLGFSRAVAPQGLQDREKGEAAGMATRSIRHIGEAIADIAALGRNIAPKSARAV